MLCGQTLGEPVMFCIVRSNDNSGLLPLLALFQKNAPSLQGIREGRCEVGGLCTYIQTLHPMVKYLKKSSSCSDVRQRLLNTNSSSTTNPSLQGPTSLSSPPLFSHSLLKLSTSVSQLQLSPRYRCLQMMKEGK